MTEKDHLEEIFRDTFQDFEGDVRPELWDKIQGQISASPAAGASSGAASGSGASGWIAGKMSTLLIAGASAVAISALVWSTWPADQEKTAELNQPAQKEISKNNPTAADNKETRPEEKAFSDLTKNNAEVNTIDPVASDPNEKTSEKAAEGSNTTHYYTNPMHHGPISGNAGTSQTSDEIGPSDNAGDGGNNDIAAENQGDKGDDKGSASAEATDSKTDEPNKLLEEFVDKIPVIPSADIQAQPQEGYMPLRVVFSNKGQGDYYVWDFGDNSLPSFDPNPVHDYKEPGSYEVKLTVSNDQGHRSESNITVVVKQPYKLDYPNVMSPNADGNNDFFKVEKLEGGEIRSYHIEIMDRGGNKMFISNDIEERWDGLDNTNGSLAPEGTYFFVIQLEGVDGEPQTFNGFISLFR